MDRFRSMMLLTLPVLLATTGSALAQTGAGVGNPAASTNRVISPRNPSGITAGTAGNNQGRMDATVGGIDKRLLNQEKDRPRLPDQAPSPSQTIPGGTASGQAPH